MCITSLTRMRMADGRAAAHLRGCTTPRPVKDISLINMPSTTVVSPPIARRQETINTIHGHRLADDYAWLREKTSPEVIAFLEQENAYTRAVMRTTEELQAALYKEMISHIKETDVSVPFRAGA